jgi:hypothetical protein
MSLFNGWGMVVGAERKRVGWKWRGRRIGAGVAVLTASLALITGCGGGGSTTSSGTEATPNATTKNFLGPKAEKKIAGYDKEGTARELDQAEQIVETSFKARAAHDWAGQCATLSIATTKKVIGSTHKTCAVALGEQGKKASPEILKNNLKEPAVALRVKGRKGYALFWGKEKVRWAVPMEREEGRWKVGDLIATPLPPG